MIFNMCPKSIVPGDPLITGPLYKILSWGFSPEVTYIYIYIYIGDKYQPFPSGVVALRGIQNQGFDFWGVEITCPFPSGVMDLARGGNLLTQVNAHTVPIGNPYINI